MRRLAIVLTLVGVLVAGCGGGGSSKGSSSGPPLTKEEYQAKLEQIAKDVGTSIGSTTTSNDLTKADVDKLVTALKQFADEIANVNPPAEVKELHQRLVAGIRAFADEFPGIAETMSNTKDPSAAIAALFGSKAIQDLSKVQQELKAKGYDLQLSG